MWNQASPGSISNHQSNGGKNHQEKARWMRWGVTVYFGSANWNIFFEHLLRLDLWLQRASRTSCISIEINNKLDDAELPLFVYLFLMSAGPKNKLGGASRNMVSSKLASVGKVLPCSCVAPLCLRSFFWICGNRRNSMAYLWQPPPYKAIWRYSTRTVARTRMLSIGLQY